MRGEIDQPEEKEEKEIDNQNVETAASHMKKDVPKWMRKGMFAQPETESNHGVTFEADTVEEKKHNKKDKKHHKHGKKDKKNKKHHKNGKKDKKDHQKKDQHKKHHKCCAFFPVCFLALIVGHLYTLKSLKTSLIALEALGANMKGYKKAVQEKKATTATAVVADEESTP